MIPKAQRAAATALYICGAGVMAGLGCASHMKYPPSWAAIPEAKGRTCEHVAGAYRDNGEVGGARQLRYSLTQILTEEGRPRPDTHGAQRAEYVTLTFLQMGALQAFGSGPERKSPYHLYTAEVGHYACREGVVVIGKGARWSSGNGYGVGRLSGVLELRASPDHLVVKWREQAFMLIGLVVPATHQESEWYRFERYRDQQ